MGNEASQPIGRPVRGPGGPGLRIDWISNKAPSPEVEYLWACPGILFMSGSDDGFVSIWIRLGRRMSSQSI